MFRIVYFVFIILLSFTNVPALVLIFSVFAFLNLTPPPQNSRARAEISQLSCQILQPIGGQILLTNHVTD